MRNATAMFILAGAITCIPAMLAPAAGPCAEPIQDFCQCADFDSSGSVDGDDLGSFVAAYNADSPDADVTGDGVVDEADFGNFVVSFYWCAASS